MFVNATVYSGAVTSTRRSRSSATDVRAALADTAGAGRRPVASAERAGAASAGGLVGGGVAAAAEGTGAPGFTGAAAGEKRRL